MGHGEQRREQEPVDAPQERDEDPQHATHAAKVPRPGPQRRPQLAADQPREEIQYDDEAKLHADLGLA